MERSAAQRLIIELRATQRGISLEIDERYLVLDGIRASAPSVTTAAAAIDRAKATALSFGRETYGINGARCFRVSRLNPRPWRRPLNFWQKRGICDDAAVRLWRAGFLAAHQKRRPKAAQRAPFELRSASPPASAAGGSKDSRTCAVMMRRFNCRVD